MSNDQTHNGWTNRETWLVHLWLSNDAGAYASCREIARESASDAGAGSRIWEEWVDAAIESAGPSNGMVCDLINAALARVNWPEIGRAFRED